MTYRSITSLVLIILALGGLNPLHAQTSCYRQVGAGRFDAGNPPGCLGSAVGAETITINAEPDVTISGGATYGSKYHEWYGGYACQGLAPRIDIVFAKKVRNVSILMDGEGTGNGLQVMAVNNIGQKDTETLSWVNGITPGGILGFGGRGIRRITVTTNDPTWKVWRLRAVIFNVDDCSSDSPPPNPTPTPTSAFSDDRVVPSCPIEAPTPSDTTFVTKTTDSDYFTPANAVRLNTFRSGGPIEISLDVERVVGEVNFDGSLRYPQELINNGVVSGTAKLSLPAYDVDYDGDKHPYYAERDHITFNGVEIGPSATIANLSGKDKQWVLNEFDIPISLVHFGKLNPDGGPPIKGHNLITIQVDEPNKFFNKDQWGVGVSWAALRFNALAPVVMIHGNSSCGDFFAGNVLTPCAGNGGFRLPQESWFITPFIEKKIPFDNSINMTPNDSIDNHARDLAIRIPEVARKFGANHVNIVAHSKGGLDVRKFLTLIKPGTLGVYSLTTLSTPHAGSPGADYQLDAREAYRRNLASAPDLTLLPGSHEAAAFALTNTLVYSDNDLRTALALAVKPNDGTPFLRVDAMRGFNEENKPLLPRSFTVDGVTNKMTYYAISADANLDESHIGGDIPWQPTITENETQGVPPIEPMFGTQLLVGFTKEKLYTQLYMLLGTVSSTELRSVTGFPGLYLGIHGVKENVDYVIIDGKKYAKFVSNDFAVHRRSAALYPIEELGFNNWWEVKANHATISSRETAITVINAITAAQQE